MTMRAGVATWVIDYDQYGTAIVSEQGTYWGSGKDEGKPCLWVTWASFPGQKFAYERQDCFTDLALAKDAVAAYIPGTR